ncbi:MAG: hypothetical protein RLZZ437_2219 [Pseudomonadota bacterium]|jgi:uncharacterized protein YndB with AHSA1/START domain
MTHTLTIHRQFAVPPARVYAAWTTPALFAQWIGPVGVPCDLIAMDATEGGAFLLDMNLPDGRVIHVAGRFTLLRPTDRIDFDWGAADGSVTTTATVLLRATATGTEMEFLHHLPDAAMAASHADGWGSAFDKLQQGLET